MKNLELALCDFDADYLFMLANHLVEKSNVSVHIFTTTEGLFNDDTDFDVTILTEDFQEVAGFRQKGRVGHKYFLTEIANTEDNNLSEKQDFIYKYQSVDRIIDEIQELRDITSAGTRNSSEKSKLLGVYSPACHELQLPFSMALCQGYRAGGRVLFLDLEEISIMPNLIGENCDRNLMDLLYEINTNTENIDLSTYVRSFMGFDYIEPFLNPNELAEIDEDTWNRFFELLSETEYDAVVVLFGKAINGFSRFIERLNKLYVLGRPGDYFRKGQEIFLDYLERIHANISIENVILPMSAGNLSDGAYQIEELLQGNLGMFVSKLINNAKVKM